MTTLDGKISQPAVHQCAEVIKQASVISPDGFTNLRFAALANVPAGSPFFPAAYHRGGEPAFALVHFHKVYLACYSTFTKQIDTR
jgi:uncharacterized protein